MVAEESIQQAEQLFQHAADLPAEDRAAYLDREAGGNPRLRQQVEALLRRHEARESGVLHNLDDTPPNRLLGRCIGPYRILELIGKGGFGSVYLAEQTEPVRRCVALKILQDGLEQRELLARFALERQALARMDHPNIARVFDAGATDDGRPYIVMELVRGAPITEYCDQNRLPIAARIRLFVAVCRAVHHAHQRGVIHRDLKPGNILVSERDRTATPKIIDFGIAKAAGAERWNRWITQGGVSPGTPDYMSPEQLPPAAPDVDVRSDVFALGVLLHEMLTGSLPRSWPCRPDAAPDEVWRAIREQPVTPPHARLRGLDPEDLAAKAHDRGTTGVVLKRTIRGDLEWILLRALEKDRERRYQSAAALAADAERYLQQRPVLAAPPGPAYRLRKFVQRHRMATFAILLIVAALCAGITVAAAGYLAAVRARHALLLERDHANANADRANANATIARDEARRARAISEFFGSILATTTPTSEPGELTAATLLQRAVRTLDDGELRKDETAEASVRLTLGRAYMNIGRVDLAAIQMQSALEICERRLGPDHRETLVTRYYQAAALMILGRLDRAEPMLERVFADQSRVLGPEDSLTLITALERGILMNIRQRYAEAESLTRELLGPMERRFGPDDPITLRCCLVLGLALSKSSRAADPARVHEARGLFRRVVDARRRRLGGEHPLTLKAMHLLAGHLQMSGEPAWSERILVPTLKSLQRVCGSTHIETLRTRTLLACVLMQQGQPSRAEPILRETLAILCAKLGPGHRVSRFTLRRLCDAVWLQDSRARWREQSLAAIATYERLVTDPAAVSEVLREYALFLVSCRPQCLRDPMKALRILERVKSPAARESIELVLTRIKAELAARRLDRCEALLMRALSGIGHTDAHGPALEHLLLRAGYRRKGLIGVAGAMAVIASRHAQPARER